MWTFWVSCVGYSSTDLNLSLHFGHLKMEAWEGLVKMWTRRVTIQHSRVLLWLGLCLEMVLTSDHLLPPLKPSGCTAIPLEPGDQVLFLFTLWEQFPTKWERDISVVCQVLENSASAKCQASGTCCWAWGKGETQRGFAQWLETPSLVLDPHWEATMSSRMKIFSTRIGLVWE